MRSPLRRTGLAEIDTERRRRTMAREFSRNRALHRSFDARETIRFRPWRIRAGLFRGARCVSRSPRLQLVAAKIAPIPESESAVGKPAAESAAVVQQLAVRLARDALSLPATVRYWCAR